MGRIITRFDDEFILYVNNKLCKPLISNFVTYINDEIGYCCIYEYSDSDDVKFDFSNDFQNTIFVTDNKLVSILLDFDPKKTYTSALLYFGYYTQENSQHADDYVFVFPNGFFESVFYEKFNNLNINAGRYPVMAIRDSGLFYSIFDNALYLLQNVDKKWINGKWFEDYICRYDFYNGDYWIDVSELIKNHKEIDVSSTYNGDKPLYITYDKRNVTLTGNGMTFKTGETDYYVCAIYGQGIPFKIADAGNVSSDSSFITVNGVKAGIMAHAESIDYSIEGQSYVELGLEDVPV